jgi:hypothetical protein
LSPWLRDLAPIAVPKLEELRINEVDPASLGRMTRGQGSAAIALGGSAAGLFTVTELCYFRRQLNHSLKTQDSLDVHFCCWMLPCMGAWRKN